MYNNIPLILKSIITIAGIALTILSIFKDWKFYKLGWIFFAILSVAAIWLNPFFEKQVEEELKNEHRPDVTVEIRENGNSQVVISIQATIKKTLIKTLSLKFNIPGVFKTYNLTDLDRVGECNIYNYFLARVNQEIIAETIHIWCENLSPNSYMRAEINYTPTLPRLIPGSKNTPFEEIYMPLMDLHDYSKSVYTWIFRGEEIIESKYINLKDLEFIKKDNENLLYNFQGIRFEEFMRKNINPEYDNPKKYRFTKEWLEKLEEDRKDW